jgi:hypothetical protein
MTTMLTGSSFAPKLLFFSSSKNKELSPYYHIEASNATCNDSTQLTGLGPDVDGILAQHDGILGNSRMFVGQIACHQECRLQ